MLKTMTKEFSPSLDFSRVCDVTYKMRLDDLISKFNYNSYQGDYCVYYILDVDKDSFKLVKTDCGTKLKLKVNDEVKRVWYVPEYYEYKSYFVDGVLLIRFSKVDKEAEEVPVEVKQV